MNQHPVVVDHPWIIPVLAFFKIIGNNVSFMCECQADNDAFIPYMFHGSFL
jgi:hypothetical protein